jgi:hypothetical protein
VLNLVDVSAANIDSIGFFCFMSKKKSESYRRKLGWLSARFAEAMRIRMLASPERGFIEYLPGEHAWRAVHADGLRGGRSATFRECDTPRFAGGREEKARAFGDGVTVVRSDQCPYIEDATATVVAAVEKAGLACRVVELRSRDDVLRLSPSPYGVFGIVRDGRLLSHYYLLEKELLPLLG